MGEEHATNLVTLDTFHVLRFIAQLLTTGHLIGGHRCIDPRMNIVVPGRDIGNE
ncbi:MAG: hypothetical protein HXS53_08370 [Theionarchaea archaeon]|nr:hypothetical protein [Theionarchaea archaeon]